MTGPPAVTRTGEQSVVRAAGRQCSFCALVRQDVVAGQTRDLCICGGCARLVLDILAEERAAP